MGEKKGTKKTIHAALAADVPIAVAWELGTDSSGSYWAIPGSRRDAGSGIDGDGNGALDPDHDREVPGW